tara:strand:+ start:3819 stop:4637 length:819 start_codon:yes stop_codon:yes gene_type:complete
MSHTTKIRDFAVIDGNHVFVTASVHHGRGQSVDPKQVMVDLHAETEGKLSAVANSFVTINDEPIRTLIQGIMTLSHAVLPVTGDMEKHGFRSLSSNIFMDKDENIWNVEETEDGKVAVRSNTIDNPDELQGLLAKCCVKQVSGTDPAYFEAVASSVPDAPESGAYVSFVHDAKTKFGFVLSSVFASESSSSYTGDVLVVAEGVKEPLQISEKQIVANVGQLDYPEPDLETAASGNVGVSQKQQLVDYYQKVFGHAPQYFAELQKRIRQHVFA